MAPVTVFCAEQTFGIGIMKVHIERGRKVEFNDAQRIVAPGSLP
jgi:hypothetical protein